MPGKRIAVRVTQADIDRAHRNDSYKCVVAQAIARTIPEATRVEVDTQSIRFTVADERRLYLTPWQVQAYVIAFDAGEPIEPFHFTLTGHKRLHRRVRTEAGKAAERAAKQALRKPRPGVPPEEAAQRAREEASAARAAVLAAAREGAESQHGQRATPRVFRTKRRDYGHRLLRINRKEAVEPTG